MGERATEHFISPPNFGCINVKIFLDCLLAKPSVWKSDLERFECVFCQQLSRCRHSSEEEKSSGSGKGQVRCKEAGSFFTSNVSHLRSRPHFLFAGKTKCFLQMLCFKKLCHSVFYMLKKHLQETDG